MTRSKNMMENNNQIDLKFWQKTNITGLQVKCFWNRSSEVFLGLGH